MQIERDKMNNNCNDKGGWFAREGTDIEKKDGNDFIVDKAISKASLQLSFCIIQRAISEKMYFSKLLPSLNLT